MFADAYAIAALLLIVGALTLTGREWLLQWWRARHKPEMNLYHQKEK